MATIKKNALANIVFPIVDGVDFASVESGVTASDFESKMTKKFFGVNHGGSAAFTSGTISKAATLVRSGIFQQTLKAAETNYDYVLYSFAPANTSLAHQMLVFNPVDYDDSDIMSRISDVGSDLRSYLVGLSATLSDTYSLVSDVDSQVLLNASMISDTYSLVSDVDSQVDLLATSDYLSAVHSDLASAIGGVTASVSVSDMSDIASRVWATTEGTRVDSRMLVVQSMVSDVDSQLTVNYNLISDVDSQVLLNASAISDVQSALDSQFVWNSAFLSDMNSDLSSQIGGVTASVSASDMSDIASRVWATTEGTRVDSRILVVQSMVSDVDSQLLLTASTVSDTYSSVSDLRSTLDSQFVWSSAFLSDMNSDLGSKIGNVSVTLTASDISDIASAVTAAGVNLTASDMSDIASRVWGTAEGTRVDSRILVVQSMVSDVDSQLTVNYNLISDVDSQVLLNASMISDVESAIDALNDPTAAAIADAVLDEPYSDHLAASTFGSRVQKIVSDISDLDSALVVHDAAVSAAISDLDSQVLLNASMISDVDSQLTVNYNLISDIDSQLLVTHSLLSDVESAVDAVWTTALTEAYNADGAAATGAQLLYGIMQNITEFAISGTTITVKKLDGSTTAQTYTLDDGTSPTSRTRAS